MIKWYFRFQGDIINAKECRLDPLRTQERMSKSACNRYDCVYTWISIEFVERIGYKCKQGFNSAFYPSMAEFCPDFTFCSSISSAALMRMLSLLESNTNSIECCAISLAVWPILCYIPTISLSKQKDKTCSLSSNICAQSQVTQTELKQ